MKAKKKRILHDIDCLNYLYMFSIMRKMFHKYVKNTKNRMPLNGN